MPFLTGTSYQDDTAAAVAESQKENRCKMLIAVNVSSLSGIVRLAIFKVAVQGGFRSADFIITDVIDDLERLYRLEPFEGLVLGEVVRLAVEMSHRPNELCLSGYCDEG